MDFYNQALQKSTFNLDSTEIIILVPGSGCSGCITKAEHFIAKYFNKLNKVKFILTNIQSYKILRLKLGEEAFHSPLLYLDKNNVWYNTKNENNIYPQVLFINNKKNNSNNRNFTIQQIKFRKNQTKIQ